MSGNYLFDLDGTLAKYHGYTSEDEVGPPVEPVLAIAKKLLAEGKDVRIFTARATVPECIPAVKKWCLQHFGQELPVQHHKDLQTVVIFDDRAISVQMNMGVMADANNGDWQPPFYPK